MEKVIAYLKSRGYTDEEIESLLANEAIKSMLIDQLNKLEKNINEEIENTNKKVR